MADTNVCEVLASHLRNEEWPWERQLAELQDIIVKVINDARDSTLAKHGSISEDIEPRVAARDGTFDRLRGPADTLRDEAAALGSNPNSHRDEVESRVGPLARSLISTEGPNLIASAETVLTALEGP